MAGVDRKCPALAKVGLVRSTPRRDDLYCDLRVLSGAACRTDSSDVGNDTAYSMFRRRLTTAAFDGLKLFEARAGQKHGVRAGQVAGGNPVRTDLEL